MEGVTFYIRVGQYPFKNKVRQLRMSSDKVRCAENTDFSPVVALLHSFIQTGCYVKEVPSVLKQETQLVSKSVTFGEMTEKDNSDSFGEL
jgi:hypothetical protein